MTDADGTAVFSLPADPKIPTGSAWFQALEPKNPQLGPITSNVLEIQITE